MQNLGVQLPSLITRPRESNPRQLNMEQQVSRYQTHEPTFHSSRVKLSHDRDPWLVQIYITPGCFVNTLDGVSSVFVRYVTSKVYPKSPNYYQPQVSRVATIESNYNHPAYMIIGKILAGIEPVTSF